jgi:hypothetical protein
MPASARNFNGTSDRIDLASAISAIAGGNARSVSIWVFPTSIPATAQDVFSYGTNTLDLGFRFTLSGTASGDMQVGFVSDNIHTTGTPILATTWQHLCIVVPGPTTTGTVLYYNGAAQTASAASGNTLNTGSTAPGIGYNNLVSANFFAGRIADLAVWNVALTATEVRGLSQGQRPSMIRSASLKGWWPIDGLQSPEPDLSGNKNNGTVTGTTAAFGPPLAPFTPRWTQGRQTPLPPEIPWGSRSFNSSTDQVLASGVTVTPNNTALSLSLWINVINAGSLGSYGGLLVINSVSTYNVFLSLSGTGPNLALYAVSGLVKDPTTGSLGAAGTWTHVALVLDATSGGTWRIYINGTQTDVAVQAVTFSASTGLYIGNVHAGGTGISSAKIADPAFWNGVSLSPLEVSALSSGVRPGMIRPRSLVAWLPIDGLQSTEPDLSGNANNGTVTGTTAAFGPPYAPLTPRWPQFIAVAAAPSFHPAWAKGKNIVIEGVAT